MNFKRNDNGEILYRVTIVTDTSPDSGETWTHSSLTADFPRHLLEQYRCSGEWMLTANLSEPNKWRIEVWLDVPEREVERCMSTIRKQGLDVENEGCIDANNNVPENNAA
jgi:hypothetical protein